MIYIAAAVMVGAFFIANWALLRTPVSLNLLFARVATPLAILLLGCAGFVLLLDLAVYVFAEHRWRAKQEESRAQALQVAMEREFVAVRAQLDRVLTGVQRLENDTMQLPVTSTPAIEPELIPPRSATARA
jgi:hypothetical protein